MYTLRLKKRDTIYKKKWVSKTKIMDNVKVSLLIQSNLSDALLEMQHHPHVATNRLEFVKWLVHTFPDTSVRVDSHIVYTQFKLGDK